MNTSSFVELVVIVICDGFDEFDRLVVIRRERNDLRNDIVLERENEIDDEREEKEEMVNEIEGKNDRVVVQVVLTCQLSDYKIIKICLTKRKELLALNIFKKIEIFQSN